MTDSRTRESFVDKWEAGWEQGPSGGSVPCIRPTNAIELAEGPLESREAAFSAAQVLAGYGAEAARGNAPCNVCGKQCGGCIHDPRYDDGKVYYRAPEPSPTVRSAATEKSCDHSGICLPDCETCDPSTDKNQDRRRRGKSPTCIDCGGAGEPMSGSVARKLGPSRVRWCEGCDVSFGWMVPAGTPSRPLCGKHDASSPGHVCTKPAGHALPCRVTEVP